LRPGIETSQNAISATLEPRLTPAGVDGQRQLVAVAFSSSATHETKAYRNNRPKAHEKRRYHRHYVALTGLAHSDSKVPSVVTRLYKPNTSTFNVAECSILNEAGATSGTGQTEKNLARANVFRVAPESGHCSTRLACLKRATSRREHLQQRPRPPPPPTTKENPTCRSEGGLVAYPFAPYGHFKLVSLCRLEHDVPWVKA